MTETLTVDRSTEGVALLTLARPDRLNAIDHLMVAELQAACAAIAADDSVRAVVLTGAGRGFCAGIDLRGFGPDVPGPEAPALDRMRFQETMAGLPGLLRERVESQHHDSRRDRRCPQMGWPKPEAESAGRHRHEEERLEHLLLGAGDETDA